MTKYLILICISTSAWCQNLDTVIYKSSFEKNLFQKAQDSDALALLLSIDSNEEDYTSAKARMDQFYRIVEAMNLQKKSDKQFAKALFTTVHDQFLRKYEEYANFSMIFKNGYYNCVSATALFATILDHYQIPYQVKEVPTHVYLVAYPGTYNIMYETTSPSGYFAPDVKAKERFVSDMVKSKLTTQDYVNRVGISKAFESLYYATDNVNLVELTSMQYSNEALRHSKQSKYEEAIPFIIKAYQLHPSPKHTYLKVNIIGTYLNGSQMNGRWDVLYLTEMGNTLRDDGVKREVADNFKSYLYQKLIKQSNDSALVATYNFLNQQIRDSTLRADITHTYHLGLMQYYAVKGKNDEAFKYASLAYQQSPGDISIQEIVVNLIVRKASRTLGNKESLNQLDGYKAEFPFLADNVYFISLYASTYAYMAATSFTSDQFKEGYMYMDLLLKEVDKYGKELMMSEDLIAYVFAEAGAYHFRLKQYEMATEIMTKGFKYAPDNGELKIRLQIVKDEPK